MYYDIVYNVRIYIPILTFIFFAILLFDKKSRFFSCVILFVCVLYYFMPDLDTAKPKDEYIKDFLTSIYTVISYNVSAMLILMYRKDNPSKKQALSFACIILTNVVVSLKVINGFHWWNYYFVTYFNEILIALALYQLWVAKDGLIRIYNGIQIHSSWYWLSNSLRLQSSTRAQKREGRS